jgi:hypothetical protein
MRRCISATTGYDPGDNVAFLTILSVFRERPLRRVGAFLALFYGSGCVRNQTDAIRCRSQVPRLRASSLTWRMQAGQFPDVAHAGRVQAGRSGVPGRPETHAQPPLRPVYSALLPRIRATPPTPAGSLSPSRGTRRLWRCWTPVEFAAPETWRTKGNAMRLRRPWPSAARRAEARRCSQSRRS